MSIYLSLRREFNASLLRTILGSGQAVVVLRLAAASKDADWVLREDQEALDHVLGVLESHSARYRFGAPLDLRWMRGSGSERGRNRLRPRFRRSRAARGRPRAIRRTYAQVSQPCTAARHTVRCASSIVAKS